MTITTGKTHISKKTGKRVPCTATKYTCHLNHDPDAPETYVKPSTSKKALQADFEQQAAKRASAKKVPVIQTKSPADIDTELAGYYSDYQRLFFRTKDLKENLKKYRKEYEQPRRPLGKYMEDYYKEQIAKTEATIETNNVELDALNEKMKPGEAEYVRRGRWTRAFLVTNGNGHVHRDRSCSTCRPTTSYEWLTDYSGKNEEELVSDAGERACTVCYASAPVDTFKKPSKIEGKDEKVKREEREEKARIKAEKDAVNAVKAIYAPGGGPLLIKTSISSNYPHEVTKEVTAEREAVDFSYNAMWTEHYAKQYGEATERQAANVAFDKEQVQILVEALAHKRNQTEQEVHEYIQKKAEAKFKRESR
jgi:ribosomal protein L12E/L44/L45/RPP1/RPP2